MQPFPPSRRATPKATAGDIAPEPPLVTDSFAGPAPLSVCCAMIAVSGWAIAAHAHRRHSRPRGLGSPFGMDTISVRTNSGVAVTTFDSQSGRDMPDESALTDAQTDADEQDLLKAVRGLADVAADVDDLESVLTQIAHLTVMSVPGAEGAGATVMRLADGRPPTVLAWAATHPFVREVDHLQYEILSEGPCLTAMQTRRPQVSGSLGGDNRYRRLGGRIARMNVHSALALPLIARDVVVGALNIYAHERDVFTEHAIAMAEQYARSAAVTVANLQALQTAHIRATQLQNALKSRATIDQAIGLIRGRTGATAEEAFDRLRQTSQRENVKLAVIAERMLDEAVRRARARSSAQ